MFFNDPSLYNVTWPTKEMFGQIPFTPYMMQNFPMQQFGQKTPYFQPYFNYGHTPQVQNFPYYPIQQNLPYYPIQQNLPYYPIQGFSLPYQTPFNPYFQASTPQFPFYGYRPF